MKIIYTILIILLFFVVKVNAAIGCSTYNGIYPNSNGTINPSPVIPIIKVQIILYFALGTDDPRCGIRDNKVKKYSPYT